MSGEKWKVVGIMLVAVLAVSVGETLLAKGMRQTGSIKGDAWAHLRGALTNGHVVGGTLLMALYFGMYSFALSLDDLSFVLPLSAFSFLLGAFLAKYYLHENVTPIRWIGALVITLGVVIVGLGSSGSGSAP